MDCREKWLHLAAEKNVINFNMKKRIFTTIIAAAISSMIILPSCNKDDNEIKLTHKDSAKVIEVLTKSQYAVGGNFSPNNGAKDIYVGTDFSIKPGVALNTPFEVKLADQTVTYRYDLKACTITDASGADFATDYNYSEQDTLITINSKILNGNTEYTLSSTIALMQQINGEWQPVVYNGDAKEYVSTSLFTTCQAADTLRPADILFSYPIDRQLNYMPKEYQEGYIMLSYKYPELFNGASANDMKVIIKNITDDTKAEQSTPFTVKESHEVEGEAVELGYSLKDIMFDPNQIYSLAFYCGDKKVHQIYFRTSFYETLKEKLKSYNWNETWVLVTSSDDPVMEPMMQYVNYGTCVEPFDIFESQIPNIAPVPRQMIQYTDNGNLQSCLIYITADLDNCSWYQNSFFKKVYDNYSLDYNDQGRMVDYPPIDAYKLNDEFSQQYLSDDNIKNKTFPISSAISKPNQGYRFSITHYLIYCMAKDADTRKDYMWNKKESELTDLEKEIKWYSARLIPPYIEDDYPYFISFRLPGKNLITYSEKHIMTYKMNRIQY